MVRKTKDEAEITREKVLQAALTVFSQKGFAAATIDDVARQAGFTRGAVYWHFGGKSELYGALIDQYSTLSSQIVQAAAEEGGSIIEILRRIFTRLLVAVEKDPGLRAMMEISLFKTGSSPELEKIRQRTVLSSRALIKGIAEAMQAGVAQGELRSDIDPETMARGFLAANNGTIQLWLSDPDAFSLEQSAPALAELHINGVSAQKH